MVTVYKAAFPTVFVIALMASHWHAANGRLPLTTPTSTPAPARTSTPPSPKPARFAGYVWVNAHVVDDRDVTAKIGDTTCAVDHPPFLVGLYRLSVPSDEVAPGCGREGAEVTFFVGNEKAAQTAVWHAGVDEDLGLVVGPSFAQFNGGADPDGYAVAADNVIVPYIGNVSCGYSHLGQTGYGATVYSDQQQPGCGREGSPVTFKLLDAQGNVLAVAAQTGVWRAFDGTPSGYQQLNLTFGSAASIHVGSVGGGPEGASPWLRLSVGLALAGLASGIGGFALRSG